MNEAPSPLHVFWFKTLDWIKSQQLLSGFWRWEFQDFAQIYVSSSKDISYRLARQPVSLGRGAARDEDAARN